MAPWVITVPKPRYAAERLFAHDSLDVPAGPAAGDEVVLRTDDGLVFALGRAVGQPHDEDTDPDDPQADDTADLVTVAYTHRLFDAPLNGPDLDDGPVSQDTYATLRARVPAEAAVDAPRRTWLVSVDLPIEAPTRAEAVRAFWSYVLSLGPRELPAFVSPADDELAMAAYVLGEETDLDPEEED